ncbi:uncharacterized protein LOC108033542 isoform X2 [Drosophila biarmipes]|uniref:uncharacterized protein LOC108033542 isoform X2 n=1 Tax=Drosophila biarmipes TaxID=125945 RepID=UPI001CDB273B|nr:uncharacterized protein LOC108033542 isoform X2 [Drosophila biarmipes]
MKFLIVILFFGIAWQYTLGAPRPEFPPTSDPEKEEQVQLDNVLGLNLPEENIKKIEQNPDLNDNASLRTNEESFDKENDEMFDNKEPKPLSSPLSDSEREEYVQWDNYMRPTLSKETINAIMQNVHKMQEMNKLKEIQVTIPQFTEQKSELTPRFWGLLVKFLIGAICLLYWAMRNSK